MSDPEIEELFDALLADFEAINTMQGTDDPEEQDEATLRRFHAEWQTSADEPDADISHAILIGPDQDND